MQQVLITIDNLRISADALMQRALACKKTAETTLAWRSIQMGKSWLGKLKGELGANSPYPVAEKVADIPPTAEVYVGELPDTTDRLSAVNSMREDLDAFIGEIKALADELGSPSVAFAASRYADATVAYALQHFAEARFWYGFELQEMRKSAIG